MMPVKTGLWHSFETLPTFSAVLAEWQRELGDEFALSLPFLHATTKSASSYPCTQRRGCGCRHTVVKSERGISAVCSCDDGGCTPIELKPSDLVIHELSDWQIKDAVRKALGFEQVSSGLRRFDPFRKVGEPGMIGTIGANQFAAHFIFTDQEDDLLHYIDGALSEQRQVFLLLTPTSRGHTDLIRTKLERNGCALMAVSECLKLHDGGRFKAVVNIEPVLAKLGRVGNGAGTDAILENIHREIRAVRTEYHETRRAKERLEKMRADGLFKFTEKIDPTSFRILCAVLVHGDVSKASRALNQSDSTVRSCVDGWKNRGGAYTVLGDLVRWRKAVGRRDPGQLSEDILGGKAASTDYAGLISDVLDELLSFDESNWEEKCEELAGLLRPYVSRLGS
jgi:hypothetical protein